MKVTVVGTGLIGGSIGLAVKRSIPEAIVTLFDRDPGAVERAVSRGAGDVAAPSMVAACADADVIFIATPVGAIAQAASEALNSAKAGAIVTDVGSTKSGVLVEVEGMPTKGRSFIGGHPMAGSEEHGIEAARADLFDGAWWILTPSEGVEASEYRTLHGMLTALGARVMALDPAEHDELMAVISHVPQLVATSLMNLAAERGKEHGGLLALAAGGFRDVTRVAASSPEIWVDICRENGPAIAQALGHLIAKLERTRDLLKQGDSTGIRAELSHGREARLALPGKAVVGELLDVRMPVPDRPGLLAQVTTTVGNLGINIEDLQISHSSEGGRGTLHLTIAGTAEANRVRAALEAIGLEAKAIPL